MNCRDFVGRGLGDERPFAVAPSSAMSWSSTRCCDSLQTFIFVLLVVCFLYPSALFVVIWPSHSLWFTYEVGCIQLPFVRLLRVECDLFAFIRLPSEALRHDIDEANPE